MNKSIEEEQMSKYNLSPDIKVKGFEQDIYHGYDAINKKLGQNFDKGVLVIDFYPGVDEQEILSNLSPIKFDLLINSDDAALSGTEITQKMEKDLTDDRIFGFLTTDSLEEYFNNEKLDEYRQLITDNPEKKILVYGFGASLITTGDLFIYADMARWEIQMRYRRGLPNWKQTNYNEDFKRKYKRAFFIEWRIADKHKKNNYEKIDFFLDTNKENNPKMITSRAFFEGLKQASNQPFRVVPYFDPGVWGGQWMKEKIDLDQSKENYAWSFDGVPEENSLILNFGGVHFETPSINLVFKEARSLLGDKVHARFGTEFPIRFDFLDTIEGQNLSLQVHPLTEYIQENFGMHYTQDESYYMLDATEEATVYLGVKSGVNKDEMMEDLRRAERGEISFPDEKYINKFPAKKHDHFLIPAGTIHCSGSGSMVLEISATPYIFTFKLWDWNRVGLDGMPRPIHIDHGEKNIQWNRDTEWVKDNLINQVTLIEENDVYREERTGLHEREFIETRRHWFNDTVTHNTLDNVNVLNLVEGKQAIVESPTNKFDPFIVNYAETFIIPASVGEYTITPYGESIGERIATIKAYVRN
jgi:mannose-6-phosphate isomerase class I